MQAPTDGLEKGHLVGVDLRGSQAGNLAPVPSRVIAILQILGRQDESGQEHPTAAMQSPGARAIVRLLLGEVHGRDTVLDADQVVEGHLEGGIARA